MYIDNVSELNKSSICNTELFEELFQLDNFERQQKYIELTDKAKLLGCKGDWMKLYNAYKKNFDRTMQTIPTREGSSRVEFDDPKLEEDLFCGSWICDEDGVYTASDRGRVWASYHPIYPAAILVNAETNTCKVVIRFKVRGTWREVKTDRSVIASNNRILSLADDSIQVTSENAKAMVKYLADIEALNPAIIKESVSTGRLGWIGSNFMPYTDNVVFDNEQSILSLFRSVKPSGSWETWLDMMLKIRQQRRYEQQIYTAASLAAPLVAPCDALPFIVSIWGGTGLGKTVALMLAASIWADPSEGAYITDAKATGTAIEVRLNALNSLPMMLDDMAQIDCESVKLSDLIYRWCAGKGKDRSNQNLGLNKMTSWANCILTNGERSLVDEGTRGGAVNRVIDVPIGDTPIFTNPDGNTVTTLVKKNYGHLGEKWIRIIQPLIESGELQSTFAKWRDCIKFSAEKDITEKQVIPMALILTADEIAEREVFKDGIRLDLNKCVSVLKDEKEISENERAYEYLCGEIASNSHRFTDDQGGIIEKWGKFANSDNDEVYIIGKKFDEILKNGTFQPRAFTAWATKKGIIVRGGSDKSRKRERVNGMLVRCVHMFIRDLDGDSADDFSTPFD